MEQIRSRVARSPQLAGHGLPGSARRRSPVVPYDPLANAPEGAAAVPQPGQPVADDFWALSGLTRRPVGPLRYQVDATYDISDQTYTATLEFTVSPPDKAYAVASAAICSP